MTQQELGKKLEEWRHRAGLSQSQLARALNKSKTYVSRRENGVRRTYRVQVTAWGRACKVADYEISQLILDSSEPGDAA